MPDGPDTRDAGDAGDRDTRDTHDAGDRDTRNPGKPGDADDAGERDKRDASSAQDPVDATDDRDKRDARDAAAPVSPKPGPAPVLVAHDLHAWYGESHILHGMSLEVRPGELVTLLGRNGAGKTTTLKAIMGMVAKRTGSVRFNGKEIIQLASNRIARLGIALCPEERGIFASLNVRENLLLPPQVRPGGLAVSAIFELFPNLKERLTSPGTKLSGGEQQMLAIGRILRTGARFLLLDEPTEGLAPVIVQQIGATIQRLKAEGFTILLVEQSIKFAQTVADRHYIVEHGRVVDMVPNAALSSSMERLRVYLGV